MTDTLDDLLLEGETVIWSGQPDIQSAGPPDGATMRRLAFIVLMISIACIVILFSISFVFSGVLSDLVVSAFSILMGAALISMLFCLLILFLVRVVDPAGERYALTNRRILAVAPDRQFTASIFAGEIAATYVLKNGSVHDVLFYHNDSEDRHTIGFYAIPDAFAIEKRVLETLMPDTAKPQLYVNSGEKEI